MTMRADIHDSRLHVVDFAEMVLHLLLHVHHVLQTHVLLDLQLDDGVQVRSGLPRHHIRHLHRIGELGVDGLSAHIPNGGQRLLVHGQLGVTLVVHSDIHKLAKGFPPHLAARLQHDRAHGNSGHGVHPRHSDELRFTIAPNRYASGQADQRDDRGERVHAVVPGIRLQHAAVRLDGDLHRLAVQPLLHADGEHEHAHAQAVQEGVVGQQQLHAVGVRGCGFCRHVHGLGMGHVQGGKNLIGVALRDAFRGGSGYVREDSTRRDDEDAGHEEAGHLDSQGKDSQTVSSFP